MFTIRAVAQHQARRTGKCKPPLRLVSKCNTKGRLFAPAMRGRWHYGIARTFLPGLRH